MVQEERPTSATSENVPFSGWVILELLGHRRLAGYLSEQQIAGASFLRLDIPGHPTSAVDGPTDFAATQFYSAAAVYAITPTSETTARLIARHSRPAPVQAWELEPPRSYDEPDYEEEGPF